MPLIGKHSHGIVKTEYTKEEKYMKKVLSLLLALCLLLCFSLSVSAAEVTSGTVSARDGEFQWNFVDGTLTLKGSGYAIDDCPWEHLRDQITNIVFDGKDTFNNLPSFNSTCALPFS